jgi:hypothetical protein
MAERLGEALLDLRTDDRQFNAGIRAAEKSAQGLGATIDKTSDNVIHLNERMALTGRTLHQAANLTSAAAQQQKLLAYQLNDTFVSLASGMPAYMVLIQQGSQIASIYGPNEGGVGRALKETASMAGNLVARLWPLAAALAGAYAAYEILRSNSAAAALEVGSLTKRLAEQAVTADQVSGMISDLVNVQNKYDQALAATAKAHSSMSAANIANTEAEFNAKKSLLELQLKYQKALLETQRAELARKALELRSSIAGAVNVDMGRAERGGFSDPRVGNFVRLPDDITALDKTQAMLNASPIVDEIKKMRAELTLNEVAAGRLDEALKSTFNRTGTEAKGAGASIRTAAQEGSDAWEGLRKVSAGVAEEMREATRHAEEQTMFLRDMTDGAIQNFFSTIREGSDAWDALADAALSALDQITNKLMNEVLDAVFQVGSASGGGASGGNILGDIFGGLFAGFRAKGGLIPNGTFGIVGEKGPEPVIGTSRGAMVLPNKTLKGMGSGDDSEASADRLKIDVGVSVDNQGNLQGYVKKVAREEVSGTIDLYDRQLPDRVQQINENPRWR